MRYRKIDPVTLPCLPVWRIVSRPRGGEFWVLADPCFNRRKDALVVADELSRQANVIVFRQEAIRFKDGCYLTDKRP